MAKARRKREVESYRCQFCGCLSPKADWGKNDECPVCNREYDAILAQEEDDD